MISAGCRVRIQTTTGGCYHKKTGTVTRVLNGAMMPLDMLPAGAPNAFPYWYRVRFDSPANNGDTPVTEEIFLASELTPIE